MLLDASCHYTIRLVGTYLVSHQLHVATYEGHHADITGMIAEGEKV